MKGNESKDNMWHLKQKQWKSMFIKRITFYIHFSKSLYMSAVYPYMSVVFLLFLINVII